MKEHRNKEKVYKSNPPSTPVYENTLGIARYDIPKKSLTVTMKLTKGEATFFCWAFINESVLFTTGKGLNAA